MHRRKGVINPILIALAKAMTGYVERHQANAGSNLLRNVVRLLFDLAGFTLLTIAGFTVSSLAGYIVAGFSCFILSRHLTAREKTEPNPSIR